MARVTEYMLQSKIAVLNSVLGLPANTFASEIGEPTKFSVGHIRLDHTNYGYGIEQIVSELGAVSYIANGMSAKETHLFLSGMLQGITLKNAQLSAAQCV